MDLESADLGQTTGVQRAEAPREKCTGDTKSTMRGIYGILAVCPQAIYSTLLSLACSSVKKE
jgi:hypothetical protein